jgi:large subunit ribosomal protein L7/L12
MSETKNPMVEKLSRMTLLEMNGLVKALQKVMDGNAQGSEGASDASGDSEKWSEMTKSLTSMSVGDLSDLVRVLEEEWGVSGAPVAVAAAASSSEGEEEKTEFDVMLVDGKGANKMQLIKALRAAVSGLGLKEAKEMAEGANVVIKSGVAKKDAEELKKSLEGTGAKVKVA